MHLPQTLSSSGFHLMAQNWLDKQVFLLRHCSPNLCKRNYSYGNLPFYKIQVNHFMAQDELSGAKIIPNYVLWMRGLVPFWVLRHSFLSLEKEMATHSSTSCLENPMDGGAWCRPSMGSQRVGHDWATDLIWSDLNLCKRNHLYGNLPFYKIQVNRFMAWDELSGAKIILKCILWVRGLVPLWVLRHSFLSLTDC